MKVILFGANGFLGKEVLTALENSGHKVISVTHKMCDITKPFDLNVSADVIVNCAAKVPAGPNDSESDFVKVNVDGVKNIVNFAKKRKILKIIHCSTLSVNLRPWNNVVEKSNNLVNEDNKYSYSKLMGEKIDFKNHIVLRLPALYGPNMKNSIIDKFIKLSKNNETIKANKNYYANFMHVKDVAYYIANIINVNDNGIINVASKNTIDMFSLANLIVDKTKSLSKVEEINELPVLTASVNTDRMHKVFDLKEMSLSDGLDNIIGSQ